MRKAEGTKAEGGKAVDGCRLTVDSCPRPLASGSWLLAPGLWPLAPAPWRKAQSWKKTFPAVCFLLLALPVSRTFLESTLILHMLVQIPLLVWVGWMVGKNQIADRFQEWNEKGVPGILVAFFAASFWMIPRWLDAALDDMFWETMKFVTIPLFIGIPLAMSWSLASSFTRGVVWTNAISMLVVVGWLYIAAPVRVCNNYLVNEQEAFGYVALALSLIVSLYWIAVLFFGNWDKSEGMNGIR